MDWLSILQQIFELCVIPLLGIVTKFAIDYIAQKKEHFTDDEVQTNNKEIEETNDDLIDEISQGFERCNSVFGTMFTIELAHSSIYNEEEGYKEEEEIDE